MIRSLSRILKTAAAGLALVASASAFAQAYPNRPITLVVPWGAGGGTDATARIIGSLLEKDHGADPGGAESQSPTRRRAVHRHVGRRPRHGSGRRLCRAGCRLPTRRRSLGIAGAFAGGSGLRTTVVLSASW
jgi:hypothetical protein